MMASAQPAASFQGSTEAALPTQQQRALAQLKTAMFALNKRHGSATTTEVLNQIIASIAVEDERALNFKPEYTDVLVDEELASPPLPEMEPILADKKPTMTLRGVPQWFSFDVVSEAESAHFGPLFSMDEERWKMYLSLRNDAVRIYEELLAQMAPSDRPALFLTSSDLRSKLHPKDDAAYVFEIWKFLTSAGVINRGRQDTKVLNVASGDGVGVSVTQPVPPQQAARVHASGYTKISCSSCGRECKFFCYKPLPAPPESLPPGSEEELEEPVKDEPMEEAEATPEEKPTYMCHDCTPAFFEKIPLRLFIDQATKERMLRGEFEEVSVDDVKSFLVAPESTSHQMEGEEVTRNERSAVAKVINGKILASQKKGKHIVAGWDGYMAKSAETGAANPLEILDPSMQDALAGAGQKIRGSVLIEQQVRNMVYGQSAAGNEEIEPVCPTDIATAYVLVERILTRVAQEIEEALPASVLNSALFQMAKKTDPVHVELLAIVWRIVQTARQMKHEELEGFSAARIEALARERVAVRKEFLEYLKSLKRDADMDAAHDNHRGTGEIFQAIKIDANVKLASHNPRQLRLVAL